MATLRKLAGETVLYGLSSILGRFINWALVPLYTYVFQEPNYPKSEYGIQTQIMAYVAVVIVLLTYGMETSFFRFASDSKYDKKEVFSITQTALAFTSVCFLGCVFLFLTPLSDWLNIPQRGYILFLLAITLAIDAYCSIPFAKLRLESRPLRFATIKLINIGVNVIANVFFFIFCPYWMSKYPDSILQYIYRHEIGIGYVFVSYFLAALVTFFLLLPTLRGTYFCMKKGLLRKMLNYALPIMVVSLAGMINLNFDKIAMARLLPDTDVLAKVGEYGAAYKLGVLMILFTQAYRYAFEPFIFSNKTEENAKQIYADALKFFTITGLVGFLAVVFYIDIIGLMIGKSYHNAFVIVPYVLLANLLLGMYYSLSLWYKLTDRTRYGAYMAFIGVGITVLLNMILVPILGYIGAAYAFLVSVFSMFWISFFWGQRYYPIPYEMKKIILYLLFAIALHVVACQLVIPIVFLNLLFRTFLLLFFLIVIYNFEPKLKGILKKRIKTI